MIELASGYRIGSNPKEQIGNHGWRVTEKIDGVRRVFVKDSSGNVRAYSRSGVEDVMLPHITAGFSTPFFDSNAMYDCELVDAQSYKCGADNFTLRTITTGKANSSQIPIKKDLMAICFDVLYLDGPTITGDLRSWYLKIAFEGIDSDVPISLVKEYGHFNNYTDIYNAYIESIRKGGEGVMINRLDKPYTLGRSHNLLKIKRCAEFEGVVIGAEIATPNTKLKGGISSILCIVDGCTNPVNVGTGFTMQERRDILENLDDYIGVMVEIDAMGFIKNNKGETSLSMPIFKRFKGDIYG